MKQNDKKVLDLIQIIIEKTKKYSQEEVVKLLNNDFDIVIKEKKEKTKTFNQSSNTETRFEDLLTSLKSMKTREDGILLLHEKCPTRKSLETIAKKIDIQITKHDDSNRLKEKIIEATIGYRLRSSAIQNSA